MTSPERIVIIDYGSQYTQLVARRIRELGVYSEIQPWSRISLDETVKGVILSGGPASVYDINAPTLDNKILAHDVPILGICYGLQLLVQYFGGMVKPGKKEYGKQRIISDHPLFPEKELTVWMSHGDCATALGEFFSIAKSTDGVVAGIQHPIRPIYGLQFHPEVTHTEKGQQMLSFFLGLCKCQSNWSLQDYFQQMCAEIQKTVGASNVLALVSGGVDSTVALALCAKAIPQKKIFALHIDNGLLRKNESKGVMDALQGVGISVNFIDASSHFLEKLKGIYNPEEKRKLIGDLFVDVMEQRMVYLGLDPSNSYLCQGTLYTDLIESGKGGADKIKSHHNVDTPRIKAWRESRHLVEPNKELFKDEVRTLGELLGLPKHILARQPFPGPGLAVRIIGEVTEEKVKLLQNIDELVVFELDKASVPYWQAFAVLLPIKTVGVKGDQHSYEHVVAVRAVDSIDGMTADWMKIPYETLEKISNRITNEISGVNRVVYDITSKPPATIEWE